MPRVTRRVPAQTPNPNASANQHSPNRLAPFGQRAVIAPPGHNHLNTPGDADNVPVVVRAYRIVRRVQLARVSRTQRKDVQDVDAAHIPPSRKAHAPTYRRVILEFRCGRGIEKNKGGNRAVSPSPPEVIPPPATGRKHRPVVKPAEQRRLLYLTRTICRHGSTRTSSSFIRRARASASHFACSREITASCFGSSGKKP